MTNTEPLIDRLKDVAGLLDIFTAALKDIDEDSEPDDMKEDISTLLELAVPELRRAIRDCYQLAKRNHKESSK